MDPEAEQQEQGGQSTPLHSTVEETIAEAQAAPANTGPHLQGVFGVLILATLVSVFLRRFGRSQTAGNLRRWLPVIHAVVWAAAVIIVTMIYARGLPSSWFLAIWLLFLVVAFASVGWLRSVMAGVALSIEGRINIGDSIRVGGVAGEVIAFGMRAIRLRGIDGSIHEIPNEKLVTEPVANLTGERGDSACELTIAIPAEVDADEAVEQARNIAVLSPLASPRHRPEVFLNARGKDERRYELHIRGYAFDAQVQDHFRSDVVSRLQSAFAQRTEPEPESSPNSDKLVMED